MTRIFGSLFCIAMLGCAESAHTSSPVSTPVSTTDAGSAPALDAGSTPVDASVGLDLLVAAFLTEYARQIHVVCPCRVEQQLFPSVRDCERRMGDPISWIDCATDSLMPSDGPELRHTLRCNVELYQKVSSCLEQHGCSPEEMNPCFDQPEQCPAWSGEAFTPVFYNCVDLSQSFR